jgi:hypothetical protein
MYLALIFIFAALGSAVTAIYYGHVFTGFAAAVTACIIVAAATVYTTYTTRIEDKIFKTGLVQQYLISNFTVDQSTLEYLKKLLKEDYNLTVTTKQLTSAIEKEQTKRELELENDELSDFKNKFFIDTAPETVSQYITQFVTVFGRGSVRNIYYLKKVLDQNNISYTDKDGFTDKIVALKNLIEAEIEKRGGPPKKEEKITVRLCPTCGNEYPSVLLFCPFCEEGTHKVVEPLDVVYCPQCNKVMVRSILKKGSTFVKGYQCRNLKCLYEMPYDKAHNT